MCGSRSHRKPAWPHKSLMKSCTAV